MGQTDERTNERLAKEPMKIYVVSVSHNWIVLSFNRAFVRLAIPLVVTTKSASLTMKKTARNAYVQMVAQKKPCSKCFDKKKKNALPGIRQIKIAIFWQNITHFHLLIYS